MFSCDQMQKGRGNHHIKDQKNIWNVDDSIRSQKYKILKTPENLNAGKKNIFMHSHLRTATSFLNAWNCSGVGSVTFKIFTATSPTAKIIMKSRKHVWPAILHSLCLLFIFSVRKLWEVIHVMVRSICSSFLPCHFPLNTVPKEPEPMWECR